MDQIVIQSDDPEKRTAISAALTARDPVQYPISRWGACGVDLARRFEAAMNEAISAHPEMRRVTDAKDQLRGVNARLGKCYQDLNAVPMPLEVVCQGSDASLAHKTAAKIVQSANAYDRLGVVRKNAHHGDDYNATVASSYNSRSETLRHGGEVTELIVMAQKMLDKAFDQLCTLESRRAYEIERVMRADGPFAVLGLSRDATAEDVKGRAHDELLRMLRPDQVHSDECTEACQRIIEAYKRLSDTEKRTLYEGKYPLSKFHLPPGKHVYALQQYNTNYLKHLLLPLFSIIPARGVKTTCNLNVSSALKKSPAFKLACDLPVTKACIMFKEEVNMSTVFRAATCEAVFAVGPWSLKVSLPLEVAQMREGGSLCAPHLAYAVGQWVSNPKNEVDDWLSELQGQVDAAWENDRQQEEKKFKNKWPRLSYTHSSSKPPVYLKGFKEWCDDVSGSKRKREEACEVSTPSAPINNQRLLE